MKHMHDTGYTNDKTSDMASPVAKLEDKWKLLPYFLKARGVMRQHIDSFDNFVNIDIKRVVRAKSNCEVRSQQNPKYFLQYLDVRVDMPSILDEDKAEHSTDPHLVNPFLCRLRDCTYSANIKVDLKYYYEDVNGRPQIIYKKDVIIGRIPIMLRSSKCILTGKSPKQLAQLKECEYDPGGYFVVKGVERVILMQEQLSRNRIIVELDAKNNISAAVTSSTHDRKSRCNIFFKGGSVYLKHNSLGDDIPIIVILKAMGLESDQEIVQLIGTEPEILDLVTVSLEDAYTLGIYSRDFALDYLLRKVDKTRENNPSTKFSYKSSKDGRTTRGEVMEILAYNVLNHVPVKNFNFRAKIMYIAQIIRRLLKTVLDPSLLDDKDYYGNKRLELAGSLISLLFEDLLKRFNNDLRKQADMVLSKEMKRQQTEAERSSTGNSLDGRSRRSTRSAPFDFVSSIQMGAHTITQGFIHAISTGLWVLKRFRMDRAGITQVLSRLSYVSALGMITRVNSQFEKTRKVSGPRSLQPSQWGMMCPADTPEGESCGLVKNLALLAHVTHDGDDESEGLVRLCFDLGVEDAEILTGDEINEEGVYLVYVNGLIAGVHPDPYRLVNEFRRIRRSGQIDALISIYLNENRNTVNIASDGGRVCRPLLVVNNGKLNLSQSDIDEALQHKHEQAPTEVLQKFLRNGIVEFVDVNEENNCFIALEEKDVSPLHTHMEIDPLTILGVVAGLVPFPHHNQSPRNTYQCAMGKQAIGTVAMNQYERFDSLLYSMVYPQKPVVTTRSMNLFNFNEIPGGQNASIAIMSYSGYDIEDAIVLNKQSLDRGFGRCMVMRKHQISVKKYTHDRADELHPPPVPDTKVSAAANEKRQARYAALDHDGICSVGQIIRSGNIMVNKYSPENTSENYTSNVGDDRMPRAVPNTKQTAMSYKAPAPSIVDKVIVTSNELDGHKLIKVQLRQCRRPEIGDKFSSRHGQKGVCGLIVNQEDMPFSDCGICPDLIMNPHGFPSRMTVGKLVELVSGKAGVMSGRQGHGTAFGEVRGTADKVDVVCEELVKYGYSYHGKDLMTSGITGEPIQAYIFAGPVFYQKLKHMVMDKMHARAKGPRAQLTRQPTEGRSRDGGLRLGEMERDCLIGYGASNLIMERLMVSSDAFAAFVCEECGLLAYENWCQSCRSGEKVSNIALPYACKLLFQELQSMNIAARIRLQDF